MKKRLILLCLAALLAMTTFVVIGCDGESEAGSGVVIRPYAGGQECFLALASGEVDGVIIDIPVAVNQAAEGDFDLKTIPIPDAEQEYFGFSMGQSRTELVQVLNAALADIIADGTYAEIYARWIDADNPPTMPSIEGSADASIDVTSVLENTVRGDGVTLTVATDPSYPPFESMEGGVPVGFDIDLVKAIASHIGAEVEFVFFEWDALLTALSSDSQDFDFAASAMTITEERAQTILFSDPYFVSVQALSVPADSAIASIDDVGDGFRVAVQNGTTGHIFATERFGTE
ncbi:MAG: transporter substrate-binding domain-containing protein [Coriobacteriia bacterium]|nr:transporter substrate-binding domain-containing protein [Coriobacteriia bacterium]